MVENEFQEICENIKFAKNIEDFYLFQISTTIFFSDSKIHLNTKKQNVLTPLENIFLNENFILILEKVLDQYVAFKKNYDASSQAPFFEEFKGVEIKNKKIIFSALIASLLPLAAVIDQMTEEEVISYSESFYSILSRLKRVFANKYSLSDINVVLSCVFYKDFYPKNVPIPKEYLTFDREYLYKYQKAASYLITLSLRLYFKHSKLNNLFKSLEKSRRDNNIHAYDISRLSNFIQNELKLERVSLDVLSGIYGSKNNVEIFFKIFKRNSNEENVYNLIAIIFQEFKLDEKFEISLRSTLANQLSVTSKLVEYGKKNFKAFNGVIDDRNYEWSNKIYINCIKLSAALSGLSDAVDKSWQRNASVKEFFNWMEQVHKILNKHDIEDDWDKISKYLYQETNTIEWKTNFFTPTQMLKSDADYDNIKRKIFKGIVKTIIGMMNTDGGVLIVGIVENPEEIVDPGIREMLVKRNDKFFYNVTSELDVNNFDIDGIKRKIQQELKRETLQSEDYFNNLWSIEPVCLKSQDGLSEIMIFKIEIKKSPLKIFSVQLQPQEVDSKTISLAKTDNFWISLLRRADASTIYTDARKYLN